MWVPNRASTEPASVGHAPKRQTVDAAEPPRIVFESPAPCGDADRGEDRLRRALVPGLAPGPGWVVTLRVERAGTKGVRAHGEILDPKGAPVAQRTIAATSSECAGLERAMGVWASLVLDAELRRAKPAVSEAQPDPPSMPGREPVEAWPASAPPENPSPEHDDVAHHDEGGALEIGAGAFLMTGTGGGALAGPAAFVILEAGQGIFLRPSVAYGRSLPSDAKRSTWAAARFDACLRVPGLYTRQHGMQLDLCGGTDIGATTIEASAGLPYFDLGPSVDLRGELGSSLSAVLRAVAGVNVLRGSFVDQSGATQRQPIAGGRLELAFSWDLR